MDSQDRTAAARIHDRLESAQVSPPFSPLPTNLLLFHREFWVRPDSFSVSPFRRLFQVVRCFLFYVIPLLCFSAFPYHNSAIALEVAPAFGLTLSFISHNKLSWIIFLEAIWRRAGTSPSKILLPSSNTSPTRMEMPKVGPESFVKEIESSMRWKSALETVSMSPLVQHWPKSFSTVSANEVTNPNCLTNPFGRHGNLPQWCNYWKHAISGRA